MKNTFVKVLSFVMALMMVVGTFSTLAVVADECDHTKGTLVETKPATCVSNGYSTYICGVCGEEWDTDVTLRDENKHNYVDVPAVEASCLTDAFSAGKKCEYCGDVLEGVKNLGGLKAHNFVGVITEATCETNKKLEYTCSICNQTAEKIAEDGEFFVEAQKKAYTEEKKWNKVEETGTALNPGHADLVWTVKTAPSQTETECLAGLAEGFCKKCEKVVRTAEIPAIHTPYKLNPDNFACGQYDNTVEACKNCQKILTANADQHKMPEAGQHKATKPVFATVGGGYDYERTVDGMNLPVKPYKTSEKFTLAELKIYGYEAGDKLAVAATCTTNGSALVQCACGAIFNEVIEAKHNFDGVQYQYNKPANCTDDYTKTRDCKVCDYVDTVVLVAAAETECNLVVVPHDAEVPTGADKSKLPGCTVNGYTYSKCDNKTCMGDACGNDSTTYIDATGHNWSNPVLVYGFCATGVYRKFCTNDKCDAGEKKAACAVENCTHSESAETCTVDGCAHDVAAKEAGTCTECTMSGEVVDRPATITDCAWGAKVTVEATCNDVAYTYIPCTICDNKKPRENIEGSVKNPNNHVFANADQLKAYVEGKIIDEDVLAAEYENDKAAYWLGEFGIVGFDKNVASTCTLAGKIHIKCIYCSLDVADTTKTVDAPYKEHNIVKNASRALYNNDGVFTGLDYSPVLMKCDTVGRDANGEYCTACGYEQKAPTLHTFDPTDVAQISSHKNAPTLYKAYPATCERAGYSIYDTTCCGRITVATSDGVAPHSYTKEYGYEAPECLEDGHHAYLGCVWCGEFKTMLKSDSEAYTCTCGMQDVNHLELGLVENYIIPALGHKFDAENSKVPAVRSTCDKYGDDPKYWNQAGTYEYFKCVNGTCAYTLFEGKVYSDSKEDREAFELAIAEPAHYGNYRVTYEDADPTCTSDGIIGGTYCAVCEKDAWVDAGTKTEHATEQFEANMVKVTVTLTTPVVYSYGEFSALVKTLVKPDADFEITYVTGTEEIESVTVKSYSHYVLKDCTEEGCIVIRCKDCTYYETTFVDAKNDEHKYPDNWTQDAKVSGYTSCKDAITESKQCADCASKLTQTKTEPTGHYTTKGVDGGEKFFFALTCDKVNEFKEYSCDICGVAYLTLALELNAKDSAKFHNVRRLYQDSTCTEKGYEIVECKNGCNFTDDALKGLNLTTATNRVIETKGETGKHTVEHAKSIELERVEPVAGVDGYVRYICGVCGKEATDTLVAHVVVDTAVAVDTTFVSSGSMIKVTVSATADAFTFYELTIKLDLNNAFKVVENSDYKVVAGTALGEFVLIDITDSEIVIYNENDENNKPVASTIDGENVELVTFYVAVKEAVSLPTYVIDTNAVSAVVGFKDDGADNVVAVDDNGTDVEIDVVSIGDLNQDGSIGRRDISMMKSYIEDFAVNGVYSAVADVNRDGSVDVVDIAALRAFVKEGQTAAAYLKLIGEDLDAALAATTAPSTIIGVTDAGDRQIVFAAAVKAAAAKFSYTDYLAICEKLGADSVVELLAAIRQVMIAEADATYPSVKITATTISVLVDDVDGNGTAGYIDIKF